MGSHLCEALLTEGHQVIGLDNFITGKPENISHLFDNRNFSFLEYNVCDFLHVEGPLDAVMNFASPASPQDYLEFPIATLKVGSQGTHKTLGLAKAKQARFLLASTSEIYGDPLVNPQPETYWGNVNPISPRGVYDEAKRFGEALTMAYHRVHGLDTRIVRIFNTYGPRMRPGDGRVISNFIVQALQGKPLTVYGNGSQTRSFCYVDDMVGGIIKLLLAPPHNQPTDKQFQREVQLGRVLTNHESVHNPVNIGDPGERTILDIATMILEQTKSTSQIDRLPLPIDDPKVRRPNIDKAKILLNWEPAISLQEGLNKTISYFKMIL